MNLLPVRILDQTNPPYFNMFHFPCIKQIHNVKITKKMHFNVCDVVSSQFSHEHVSAAIPATFRVILLQEHKGTNVASSN